MKKGLAIVLIIVALLLGGGGTFLGFYFYHQGIVDQYQEQVSRYQASLDAVGTITTTYTVTVQTTPGQLITDDMIDEISIPMSMINESFVTDYDMIVGKYSKVAILPGTPITADVLMEDDINNERNLWHTVREYDIVVNMWPIGLKIGDYVDMRIMMPYGEEYIVLSHMRVNGMSENTVKFLLTETQINLYQSAMVDYYLNSSQGVMLYFTKYIEPGVQKPANITYKVSDKIMEAMKKNPNLYATAWASVYDATSRNEIEADLVLTPTEQEQDDDSKTSAISGGRGSWAGTIAGGEGSYTDVPEETGGEEDDEW